MGALTPADVQKILHASRIGLWKIEFETDRPSRLYTDELMDELIGITPPATPEERFAFFHDRIHPDDMELFQDYVAKLSEVRTEIVYRYIHPISGEMWVRCDGARDTSVRDIICVTGSHQDISETVRLEQDKLAERRLAEQNLSLRKEQMLQETYYRELMDIQNCGLLAYTMPGHKIIHMNAEALRMYNIGSIAEAQAQLGTLLSHIYYPDPETIPALKKMRCEDTVVDYECILNYGLDGECHIMAKTKSLRMPNGDRAVITTFLDVSDMMMLRRALRQAEEGSRAKSAFLFAMSHDLRTPMNAIIGYADLIERHWEQRELSFSYLEKLKNASRFLLALIGNVLELSRIESGKEHLHDAAWNLHDLSKTMDVLLENEIENRHLTITRDIDISHPNVICDALKLREILMNLLNNAVKYTPAGGTIFLTIKQRPADTPDQTMLCLSVADTGSGISPDYLPHLFEAFSREKDSSESGIMGTGLGLRIVKSFVDLMGGTIQVESTPGKGSCFTVEIPLKLTDAPSQPAPSAVSDKQLEKLSGKRILLAEDNELNAEITATILQDSGIQTEIAPDGETALSMLTAAPQGYYDLILMDIQMPRLNGYQTAQAIRALSDERSRTPIIAMTANAFEEDRQAAFAAGMDDYTTKPIEAAKLLQVMAKVMEGR